MAIKKSAEAPAAINIEQMADLYAKYYKESKDLDKKMKEAKAALVQYAEGHRSEFDGTALRFGDTGVYVERRERISGSWNEDKLTMDWLNDFVDDGFGEMVDIKLNDRKLNDDPLDADEIKLCEVHLRAIGYEAEVKEMMAVCMVK